MAVLQQWSTSSVVILNALGPEPVGLLLLSARGCDR